MGDRTYDTGVLFMEDLASPIQLTTDGLPAYFESVVALDLRGSDGTAAQLTRTNVPSRRLEGVFYLRKRKTRLAGYRRASLENQFPTRKQIFSGR